MDCIRSLRIDMAHIADKFAGVAEFLEILDDAIYNDGLATMRTSWIVSDDL